MNYEFTFEPANTGEIVLTLGGMYSTTSPTHRITDVPLALN